MLSFALGAGVPRSSIELLEQGAINTIEIAISTKQLLTKWVSKRRLIFVWPVVLRLRHVGIGQAIDCSVSSAADARSNYFQCNHAKLVFTVSFVLSCNTSGPR